MNRQQESIDHLERLLKESYEAKSLLADMHKLLKNQSFRRVILEYFCVQEAARYVHTSVDSTLPESNRANALARAQAAGHLKAWLAENEKLLSSAVNAIPEREEELAYLRSLPEEDIEDNQETE